MANYRVIILISVLLVGLVYGYNGPANLSRDEYIFYEPLQQQRFVQLTHNLRCVVCQNETLAGSNAPQAKVLRQQVYDMIQAGASDQVIYDFFVQRYGDFVVYSPQLTVKTYVLWGLPWLLLIVGLVCWWRGQRRGV